jgi:hypothetical protein
LKSDLTLLIATRGRPQAFLRAAKSALELCTEPLRIRAYVDEDDSEVRKYKDISLEGLNLQVGPRLGSAPSLKELLKVTDTDWIMLGSDDVVFETKDWNTKLRSAFLTDKMGVSFPADGQDNECSHFMFHRRMYELTGLWPDVFWHFGPDGYLGKVVEAVGRRLYVKDVMVRHLKAKNGLSPKDQTFWDERSRNPTDDMKRAMLRFDHDVSILKAEVERVARL